MNKTLFILQMFVSFCLCAKAPYVFEGIGIWKPAKEPSVEFVMDKIASSFLPYNPIAIELHSNPSNAFSTLEKKYPQGTFIRIQNFAMAASFIPIDLFRIDTEEALYPLLRKMPTYLHTVKVLSLKLCAKTKLSPVRLYLSAFGFKLLFSYFAEEEGGEAIFIRKDIYESVFE